MDDRSDGNLAVTDIDLDAIKARAEAATGILAMLATLPPPGPRATRTTHASLEAAYASARDVPVLLARVAELEAERDEALAEADELRGQRDEARAHNERLARRLAVRYEETVKARTERDAMRPVVEAAEAWRDAWSRGWFKDDTNKRLLVAVDAWRAAQPDQAAPTDRPSATEPKDQGADDGAGTEGSQARGAILAGRWCQSVGPGDMVCEGYEGHPGEHWRVEHADENLRSWHDEPTATQRLVHEIEALSLDNDWRCSCGVSGRGNATDHIRRAVLLAEADEWERDGRRLAARLLRERAER